MIYFVQVVAYSGLMLLLYLLLLKDRPMHKFNRVYLLVTVALPLVLPFLQLPEVMSPQAESQILSAVLPGLVISTGGSEYTQIIPSWSVLIIAVYIITAVVLLSLKAIQYVKLHRLISKSSKEQYDGYTLLRNTGYGPGSWRRYILLPESDVDEAIVRHEVQHIQLRHSRDMVVMNIMQAITWPNVFVHFIKKELVQVHEFQADAGVDMQATEYSELLLASVFNTCALPLTHSFIIHPIKRRIMMLNQKKSNTVLRGIVAMASTLVLIGGIVTVQSCQQKAETDKRIVSSYTPKEDVLSIAHKMPAADYDIMKFMSENTVYPQEAMDKGIEGRVMVKFVVDDRGHIGDIHTVGKKADPLLEDAALKVIAAMPDWQPGEDEKGNKVKVMYTIPVQFKLGKDTSPTQQSQGQSYFAPERLKMVPPPVINNC